MLNQRDFWVWQVTWCILLCAATYSLESPLGQLVYYGTNYAPEIMTAVMDMSSNGNMDMVSNDDSNDDGEDESGDSAR